MRLFLIAGWLAFTAEVLAQGVFINVGESYVFQFNSLNYSRPAFPGEVLIAGSGQFEPIFPAYSITQGESFLLEAFQNSPSDVPVSWVFSYPENPNEMEPNGAFSAMLWWDGSQTFWSDLQGVGRITMLTGNAEVSGFFVRQIVDDSLYMQTFPVPEPSSYALFMFGLVFLVAFQSRRNLRADRTRGANPPLVLLVMPGTQFEQKTTALTRFSPVMGHLHSGFTKYVPERGNGRCRFPNCYRICSNLNLRKSSTAQSGRCA